MSVTHTHMLYFQGTECKLTVKTRCFEFQGAGHIPASSGHHSVTLHLLVQPLFVLETNAKGRVKMRLSEKIQLFCFEEKWEKFTALYKHLPQQQFLTLLQAPLWLYQLPDQFSGESL